MAQLSRRLPQNVAGEFYVDDSCIDCDTCRQIAPAIFRDHGGQSSVFHQPANPGEIHRALMALVCCPTASIGSALGRNAGPAVASFPIQVAVAGDAEKKANTRPGRLKDVYFCGFTSEASFGAWSYLITGADAAGNVLVDCPRFTRPLVRKLEQMGGVSLMFLTHRDDIGDHVKFAAHFGCPRVMHVADGAARLGIERMVEGDEPLPLGPELLAIPAPGHTRGHMVLLYREQALFTGDHLAWEPEHGTLTAFRDVCWYSWPQQTRSMERLLPYRFEWVLPGHGRIGHCSAAEMHQHLVSCIERMKRFL